MSFILFICIKAHLLIAAPSVEELKYQIENAHKHLVDAEVKKRGVLGALFEINLQISKVNVDADQLQSQLETFKNSVKGQAREVLQLQTKLEKGSSLLKARLRAIYKLGLSGSAKIILSSRTPGELARNIKFLGLIAKQTKESLDQYRNDLDHLEVAQRKLKRQVEHYALKKSEVDEKLKRLSEERAKQKILLADIEKNRERHLQALSEYRSSVRGLEDKIRQIGAETQAILKTSFLEVRGKLAIPVAGEITQKYGMMTHKYFNTKLFHKGIFIKANLNRQVTAPFNGKVAYSGWLDGYGETIILDHGDRYYSLYAHNSKLLKATGEQVELGDQIALSGESASLRGPGLYFEIRHFSESLDPMQWLDLRQVKSL